jgi:hypothetical protein
MKIDTDELFAFGTAHLYTVKTAFENISLGDVGVGLLAVGCVLAAAQLYKDWKKRKGYRMAVRERDVRETELLTNILGDGLFEAEHAGKISNQRARALYDELSRKLDLHDLVPKQHRLKTVKEQIKTRLVKSGKLDPTQIKRTTFAEKIGKFWNTGKA